MPQSVPAARQAAPAANRTATFDQAEKELRSNWPASTPRTRRGHCGKCRKQPFVVAVAVICLLDLARKIIPVNEAAKVVLLAQVSGCTARDRDERENSPVAQQDRCHEDRLRASGREKEDHRGSAIANRDSLQDPGHPQVLEFKLKQAVPDQAQQEEKHNPPRDPQECGGLGMLSLVVLPQRKRQDHANHEEKEREDQVVEMKPLPVDVLELVNELSRDRSRPPFADRPRQPVAPHDPEHVKAPKRVDGEEAFGARQTLGAGRIAIRGAHGHSDFDGLTKGWEPASRPILASLGRDQ